MEEKVGQPLGLGQNRTDAKTHQARGQSFITFPHLGKFCPGNSPKGRAKTLCQASSLSNRVVTYIKDGYP